MGFARDRQGPCRAGFPGPLKLRERLGTLDAKRIATTDPATLEELFRQKPAIHRFPGSMATRVQDLAATIADEYDGDASRLWTEAADGADLKKRIAALAGS